jgi:hypothetical protein
MWFDEWQSWLIAKDAGSIRGLFRNLHYETHPPLWHLCLYAITRITGDVRAMQAFHLALAATGVFIVAAWSPLTRRQAVLYAFGYFVIYEYCVISRCYVLGLILTLVAAGLFRRGPGRLGFYLVLAALAQVDAFSMALALALAAADVSRTVRGIITGSPPTRARLGVWTLGMIVFAGSCVTAYLRIMPAPDCTYANTHGLPINPLAAAGSLFCVWAPIPQFTPHFWNTNILDGTLDSLMVDSQTLQAVYSAVLFVLAILLFSDSAEAVVLFVLGCIGIIVELCLSRQTVFRHAGHLFILLIASYWIAEDTATPAKKRASARRAFLTFILIVQLIPAAWAFYVEGTLPFSESLAVANFIKRNFPPDIPVVAGDDMAATALSGYLGRPVYFASRQAYGTYLIWDSRRPARFDPFSPMIDFQARCKRDAIFLLPPYWIADGHAKPPPELHLKVLGEFDHLIYYRDAYEVTLAKYVPPSGH